MGNTQAISDPIAVGRSTDLTVGVDLLDHRRGMGALGAPASGATASSATGVFPGGTSGAGRSARLQPYWTSGMTIGFNPGHFQSERGTGGPYIGMAYGTITRTLDAGDSTNPRIDYLVIRVKDPAIEGASTAESARIEILKGTPAASPQPPTSQLLAGDVLLCGPTIPAGATSLSAAIIAAGDRRRFITARGGITPYTPGDIAAGAYEGDPYYNLDKKTFDVWDGTAFVPIAAVGKMTEYSPELYYGGNGTTAGASVVNLGTNPTKYGKYQVLGKKLRLTCQWKWGTAPYNAGTGPINALLPSGLYSRKSGGEQHFYGYLYTTSQGNMSWPIDVGIRADSNVLVFAAPTSAADGRLNYYKVASTAGSAGTGTPYIAGGYPEGGSLAFTAEIELE